MKRILVGVDGSPESLEAVKWTADLAASLGAEVIVASAFGFYPVATSPSVATYITQDTIDRWRKDLQHDMDGDWTKPLREAGIKFTTQVKEGHASEVLLQLAQTNNADLIAVGSRGHNAVAEMFLGSVSHNLVLRARCPVVVLPHRQADHHSVAKEAEATLSTAGVSG
jgi:nucleotide-binding universal stress UspA family protein